MFRCRPPRAEQELKLTPIVEPEPSPTLVIDIAQYPHLKEARERGLALSARGITYSIGRSGKQWIIRVALDDVTAAMTEIVAYEEEIRLSEPPPPEAPALKTQFWSLPFVALLVVLGAVVQAESGPSWLERGLLAADRVVAGREWWRSVTALTLHGDVPHVVANVWVGLLFGGLLIPSFGQGLTWLAVLVAGGLGNLVTAFSYFPEPHRSRGASTAVFGALGLLVGDAVGGLVQRRTGRSWWRWVVPLGAGVCLLAYLGAGDGKASVDVLAHLWGFVVGVPMGVCISFVRPVRLPNWAQTMCGCAALLGLLGAWWFAGAGR